MPAALPLFIALDYSQREEGNHFFGVLFSSFQVMHSNLQWMFQAASGAGEQMTGLGTLFPSHPWAEPPPGL